MRPIHAIALLLISAASCRKSDRVDPLAKTDEALTQFAGTLRGKLGEAMKAGGPAGAVEVCAKEAPALYAKMKADTGVIIGRSSLRLRNPADAPPPWVADWLKQQGERKAEGVHGIRVIDGNVARVLRPIAIEAPCLACHGKQIAPEVRDALAAKYPTDAATGYELGDLRGALWGELPIKD